MLALGRLLRPNNPEPGKLTTYECGEPPTGNAWINFNIRFYLVALIFVIFDVEVAFIYPVAVVFRDWVLKGQGLFALAEILRLPRHSLRRPGVRLGEGRPRVAEAGAGRASDSEPTRLREAA